MTKQTKNLFQELGDVLAVIGTWIASVVTALWNWLGTWRWKSIKKILGMVLTMVSSVALVGYTVLAVLVLGDPHQVTEIIKATCGINIFDYITKWNYYGFALGGFIMDLVVWTALLWWGLYWWSRVNYFTKPKKAWLYLGVLWTVGFTMFAASIFYMAPQLVELKKVMHKKHTTWHEQNGHERMDYNHGYNNKGKKTRGQGQYEVYSPYSEHQLFLNHFNNQQQQFDQLWR